MNARLQLIRSTVSVVVFFMRCIRILSSIVVDSIMEHSSLNICLLSKHSPWCEYDSKTKTSLSEICRQLQINEHADDILTRVESDSLSHCDRAIITCISNVLNIEVHDHR
jgi:hypothetical protein